MEHQSKDRAIDPLPQRISLDRLYIWPGNPRHADENGCRRVADADIKNPEVQAQVVKRVREVDNGHHLMGIASSIGLYGLLGNHAVPIVVCSLGDRDFLVIDGNARVVALRDYLDDEGWCRAHAEYVQRLQAGIMVMDFGPWSEHDVRLSVLEHTAHIHMSGVDESGNGFERPLDDRS